MADPSNQITVTASSRKSRREYDLDTRATKKLRTVSDPCNRVSGAPKAAKEASNRMSSEVGTPVTATNRRRRNRCARRRAKKLEACRERCAKVEIENEKLNLQVKVLEEAQERYARRRQDSRIDLVGRLNSKVKELEASQERCAKAEIESQRLNSKVKELEVFRERCAKAEIEIGRLNSKVKKLEAFQDRYVKAEIENHRLNSKVKELGNLRTDLVGRLNSKVKELEAFQDRHSRAEIENERLNSKVNVLEESQEKYARRLNSKVGQLEASQDRYARRLSSKVKELELSREKYAKSEIENGRLNLKVKELEVTQEKYAKAEVEVGRLKSMLEASHQASTKVIVQCQKESRLIERKALQIAKKFESSLLEYVTLVNEDVLKAESCLVNAQEQWQNISMKDDLVGSSRHHSTVQKNQTQTKLAQNEVVIEKHYASSAFFMAVSGEIKALEDRVKVAKKFERLFIELIASARQEVTYAESCVKNAEKQWEAVAIGSMK